MYVNAQKFVAVVTGYIFILHNCSKSNCKTFAFADIKAIKDFTWGVILKNLLFWWRAVSLFHNYSKSNCQTFALPDIKAIKYFTWGVIHHHMCICSFRVLIVAKQKHTYICMLVHEFFLRSLNKERKMIFIEQQV